MVLRCFHILLPEVFLWVSTYTWLLVDLWVCNIYFIFPLYKYHLRVVYRAEHKKDKQPPHIINLVAILWSVRYIVLLSTLLTLSLRLEIVVFFFLAPQIWRTGSSSPVILLWYVPRILTASLGRCANQTNSQHDYRLPDNANFYLYNLKQLLSTGRSVSHSINLWDPWKETTNSIPGTSPLHIHSSALKCLEFHKSVLFNRRVLRIQAKSLAPTINSFYIIS